MPTLLMLMVLMAPAVHASDPDKVGVRKCCGAGEYMSTPTKCSPVEESTMNVDLTDPWWWVNATAIGLPVDFRVEYASRPGCSLRYRKFLTMEDLRLSVNGSIMQLEALVESSKATGEDDETWHTFLPEDFCLDNRANGHEPSPTVLLCPCSGALTCVRKCCEFTMEVVEEAPGLQCMYTDRGDDYYDWVPDFQETNTDEEHRFFSLTDKGPDCSADETLTRFVIPRNNSKDPLNHVFEQHGGVKSKRTNETFERNKFCGDHTTSGHEIIFACLPTSNQKETMISITFAVFFAFGSLALLATVVVSLLLPETRRKINGRMALAHNATLLVAYVTSGSLHFIAIFHMGMTNVWSKILGLIIQFSFLSSFFWLNVMCIDIFWVFSGLRPIQGSVVQREKKKFAYYSLYAWGCTFAICIATVTTEFGSSESALRPAFGEGKSYFFNSKVAMLVFFYGPMAALLTANTALFVYTAIKIFQAKRSTAILHSEDSTTNKKNQQRLALYGKLFCLMGVTWVFEVVGWAVGGDAAIWVLFDLVNLSRAFFVFFIFCCKRSVWRRLVARFTGRETGWSTASRDTRTTSSNVSHTQATRKISQQSNKSVAISSL